MSKTTVRESPGESTQMSRERQTGSGELAEDRAARLGRNGDDFSNVFGDFLMGKPWNHGTAQCCGDFLGKP